jgi:outer membrane protein assembly factor BamE
MQKIFQLLLLTTVLGLAGCFIFYKSQMKQGKFFTKKEKKKLKVCMSKGELRYILVSKILKNTFDQNRWDYVYTLKKGSKLVKSQRLTLHFSGDRLVGIV